jgi:hypothetical protein
MKAEYVPLLRVQRELQGLPRNYDRFRQYLRTMTNRHGEDGMLIPLLAANPMAKDHVTALLDALLALDADAIAARAAGEACARLRDVPGEAKVTLVVADDVMGGWTNRYDYEFQFRFQSPGLIPEPLPRWLKHFWLMALLWSSEPATERAVREAILAAIYRAAYVHRHGPARTLRDMLAQEGAVMTMAGCTGPTLDAEDVAYTREVVAPYLGAGDKRTVIECMFGDVAGRTLGFTPRGLSHWAGLALALHDGRDKSETGPLISGRMTT